MSLHDAEVHAITLCLMALAMDPITMIFRSARNFIRRRRMHHRSRSI